MVLVTGYHDIIGGCYHSARFVVVVVANDASSEFEEAKTQTKRGRTTQQNALSEKE